MQAGIPVCPQGQGQMQQGQIHVQPGHPPLPAGLSRPCRPPAAPRPDPADSRLRRSAGRPRADRGSRPCRSLRPRRAVPAAAVRPVLKLTSTCVVAAWTRAVPVWPSWPATRPATGAGRCCRCARPTAAVARQSPPASRPRSWFACPRSRPGPSPPDHRSMRPRWSGGRCGRQGTGWTTRVYPCNTPSRCTSDR